MIDLIASTEPLDAATVTALIEQRYEGSSIRGVWLLLDPSNAHSSQSYFLLKSGVLPSAWADNGSTTRGTLVIDEGGASGTFRFPLEGDQVFEEAVAIRRDGVRVRMEGRVPEGARWNPDTLSLELQRDLLIGASADTAGVTASVVLRKPP